MTIKELERICAAATPGPWGWCYDGSSDWSVGPKDDPQGRQIASCWRSRGIGNPDAEFIAAFNPAVVSKLLAIVEAADSLLPDRIHLAIQQLKENLGA